MSSRPYCRRNDLNHPSCKISAKSPVKIVLLGRLGSGKSAITVRFLTRRYIGDYHETLESYHRLKQRVDGEEIIVDILDTANRDTSVKQDACMMWGDGFLLVYSVTNRQSFEDIKVIKESLSNVKDTSDSPILIVGNKKDLEQARQVSYSEGRALSYQLNCPFLEISTSVSFAEVEAAFKQIIKRTIQQRKRKESLEKASYNAVYSIKSILGRSVGRSRAMSNSGEGIDEAIIQRSRQTTTRRKRANTCPSEM